MLNMFGMLMGTLITQSAGVPRDRALTYGLVGGMMRSPVAGAVMVQVLAQRDPGAPAQAQAPTQTPSASAAPTRLSSVPAEIGTMPDFKDTTFDVATAQQKLGPAGNSVQLQIKPQAAAADGVGKIIGQLPNAGEQLRQGQIVTVTVTVGIAASEPEPQGSHA